MRTRLSPSLLAVAVLLVVVAATPAAAAISVTVAGDSPAAAIGQDLVLELVVRSDGDPLDPAAVTVSADAPFLGAPYPLRRLTAGPARELRFEWAAPVPADIEAGVRPLTLTVGAGGQSAAWNGEVVLDYGGEWSDSRINAFIERRGLPLFLVLVFGFGVLMSLSPCIYPMIPITLAVIGAQSQDKGAGRGFVLSVTYVLGMALVYAVIGLIVATVFSGLTAYLQSPVVVGPIALLLVVLSFSMFGAYELQAPQFLRDRLQGPGGRDRSGLLGVFLMGIVAGLVASPCVGPFLNALLLVIATMGNWLVGFVSLFLFGLGMGLLLIGVGTFPALLGSLPGSGGWMETVKKGMGLVLVAMAFWFVRPGIFLPAKIFYPLLGATAVVTGVFVGAFDPLAAAAGWWDRTRKGLGILFLAVGLLLLGRSFLGHVPLPAASGPAPTATVAAAPATGDVAQETAAPAPALPAKVQWETIATGADVRAFLDDRLAAAKAAGRPVMVDFWAEWCVYCKKLDKSVWNDPAVVAEAQRFVTIKVDATAPDDDEMTAIKEAWDVAGLPRVVFLDSRGEYLAGRSTGFNPAPQMLEIMQSIR